MAHTRLRFELSFSPLMLFVGLFAAEVVILLSELARLHNPEIGDTLGLAQQAHASAAFATLQAAAVVVVAHALSRESKRRLGWLAVAVLYALVTVDEAAQVATLPTSVLFLVAAASTLAFVRRELGAWPALLVAGLAFYGNAALLDHLDRAELYYAAGALLDWEPQTAEHVARGVHGLINSFATTCVLTTLAGHLAQRQKSEEPA
jgi:hypothetical protein